MRYLERPSSEFAFLLQVWSSSLNLWDINAVLKLHGVKLHPTQIIADIENMITAARLSTSCRIEQIFVMWRCWKADRSFPGGLVQTDGYAKGNFPTKVSMGTAVT